MKRNVWFWVATALVLVGVVCYLVFDVSGSSKSDVDPVDSVTVDSVVTNVVDTLSYEEVNTEGFVERTVSLDKEYMYANVNPEYRWYETCVVLDGYLDELTEFRLSGVANVFQDEKAKFVTVYLLAHTVSGADSMVVVPNDFWVEDFDMNKVDTTFITVEEAFVQVQKSNYKLPHSHHIVLRQEIGPNPGVNPQYIFGNGLNDGDETGLLYVDAVTGAVTDVNPTGVKH